MICNVTVACAIALMLIGSFQGVCTNGRQLMDQVTTIAKDDSKAAEQKTTDIREKLGDLMEYDVDGKRLLPKRSSGIAVNQVNRLHNHDTGDGNTFYLIPFLLASFNLPNTLKEDSKRLTADYLRGDEVLYTVFNVLHKIDDSFSIDVKYWLLPFEGTDFDCSYYVSNLAITLPENLSNEGKKVIVDCLTAM
jgi:hypothetical protein